MTGVELALSASARQPLCALRRPSGEVVVARSSEERPGSLEPTVAALFRTAGASPRDLRRILVDVGPGSYTGLRISITFARTLSEFSGASLAEITSLELLAHATRAAGQVRTGLLRVVLDARRGRFHTGRLRLGDVLEIDEAPRAVDRDALLEALCPGELVVAEEAVQEPLASRCSELGIGLVAPTGFDAAALFADDLAPREVRTEDIAPLYLMGSYAEEP